MTGAQTLIQQKLALLQEAEIALYSIETGLGQLRKNRPYAPKPYYFSWFILLSTGFERLMKVVICLHEFEATGAFPTRKFLQSVMRHNLIALRDEVISRCYTPAYRNRSFGQEDYDFITGDDILLSVFNALSDFSDKDRYLFMDRISEPGDGREWPKGRWEEIERLVLSDAVFYHLLQNDYPELKKQANQLIQACIERFTRALTRLFIFGNLGDLGTSQYALISGFARLDDTSLGSKEYER